MKFGANTWIWFSPFTLEEVAATATRMAAAGFDLIEFPIETIDAFDYQQAGAIARDHGLSVGTTAAMSPDRDLIHPDETIRQNGMAYIRHCVDAARILGAENVVGPMYSAVGRTWQATEDERARDLDLLVAQLRELSAYASDYGVTLCVEPLNRFETSFINLASQGIEVVDRVGSPACRLLLDTFHMNIEEKSLGDAIRAAGSRLKHFHACGNDRGVPGSGNIDWTDVAGGLRDINYDGPVVIESFTAKVQSIARAAAIWRPLAPSQDAIAYDGLKFLKQLLA
jgi:D-psicose/D-tagatose/L-ribulose 3-epimerase